MIYVCLLAGVIIVGLMLCKNKTGNLIYCILSGVAMFLISALRRSVGYDYNKYSWEYYGYISESLEEIAVERTEKGYGMIAKLLADYTPEYQWIFILLSAFFAVATSICVYKLCKRPYIGVAFFLTFGVYFNTMNFMRQFVAAFIMVYAFRFVKKNQFGRFLVIVLFATCLHRSAIFMIPFYFILRIKMNYISLGVYTGIAFVFMLFSWQFIDFFSHFLFSYKGYMLETNPDMAYSVNPVYVCMFIPSFAVAFMLRKRMVKKDPFNNVWLNCMFFMTFFMVLGAKHSALSRLGAFFIVPVALIFMPRVFEEILEWCRERSKKDKKKLLVLTSVTVSAIAVYNFAVYGYMLADNYNGVVPYRTMFENFETEAAE